MPDLRDGSGNERGDISSQRGDAGAAADAPADGEYVQDVHRKEVLGFYGEESAARTLGHDLADCYADLSGDEHGDVHIGAAEIAARD